MDSPGSEDFNFGVTLDAFLKFLKSSSLRGHLKKVLGGPGGNQVSNMVLSGINELPWPRGFQIGVPLGAFLKCLNQVL